MQSNLLEYLLVLVMKSLQMLAHGFQLSMKSGKSFVPSL